MQQYTLNDNPLAMRAGIECGTVTAGIIGKMKFCYDIWGVCGWSTGLSAHNATNPRLKLFIYSFQPTCHSW